MSTNNKKTHDECMTNNVEYNSKNNKNMTNMTNNVEYAEYIELTCFSTNIKKLCQKCSSEKKRNDVLY